jgi:hypothetical protein
LGRELVGLVRPWEGAAPTAAIDSTALVASVWIPLAAALTPANVADNEEAVRLLRQLREELRSLLGGVHYNDPALRDRWQTGERVLITTRRGAYPYRDAGVEVRCVFHQLRSHAIENINEQVKAIFDVHGPVPTKGCIPTRRWLLGTIFTYQHLLFRRLEPGQDLRAGLKAYLRSA